jgi:hypothetical protein
MAEPRRTSDIYGIFLNRSSSSVLLMNQADGWTLPHVHLSDKRLWLAEVGLVSSEMSRVLAADITVLRNVYADYSEDRTHVDLIYELENQAADWPLPSGANWIDRSTLNNLPLAHPEQRPVIESILQEAETGDIPALRAPWARPGWNKAASTWMRQQLVEQNYVLVSPIEQLKTWGISCLLKVSSDRGDIFFKVASSLPLFGNEPALLKALSDRYPAYVPAPIAVEPNRRWMLMGDFGAELRTMPTLERWETAARRFGELQVQAASAVQDLLALGCLDRRLKVLSGQIDPLLADDDNLTLLSADELAIIRSLAPRLKAMCAELATYHVPYTLNHGDLHSGNITGETLLFFDWTDACIAHPFLDLSTVVTDMDIFTPSDRQSVLDTYFSLWTAYEPMYRLRAMWQLAEPLGALHQAVSYQHIVKVLEPTSRQELIWGVSEWLRRMVKSMPQ